MKMSSDLLKHSKPSQYTIYICMYINEQVSSGRYLQYPEYLLLAGVLTFESTRFWQWNLKVIFLGCRNNSGGNNFKMKRIAIL